MSSVFQVYIGIHVCQDIRFYFKLFLFIITDNISVTLSNLDESEKNFRKNLSVKSVQALEHPLLPSFQGPLPPPSGDELTQGLEQFPGCPTLTVIYLIFLTLF